MPVALSAASAAMHGAVVPIAYTKLTSAGSFSFSNIPQNYQDLMLVIFARSNYPLTQAGYSMQFNGQSGTQYSNTYLTANGSNATSGRGTSQSITFEDGVPGSTATASVFGTVVNHIFNYSNTSTYKTVLSRSSTDIAASGGTTRFTVNLWSNTSAMTSIVGFTSGTFVADSTATLYGIRSVGQ